MSKYITYNINKMLEDEDSENRINYEIFKRLDDFKDKANKINNLYHKLKKNVQIKKKEFRELIILLDSENKDEYNKKSTGDDEVLTDKDLIDKLKKNFNLYRYIIYSLWELETTFLGKLEKSGELTDEEKNELKNNIENYGREIRGEKLLEEEQEEKNARKAQKLEEAEKAYEMNSVIHKFDRILRDIIKKGFDDYVFNQNRKYTMPIYQKHFKYEENTTYRYGILNDWLPLHNSEENNNYEEIMKDKKNRRSIIMKIRAKKKAEEEAKTRELNKKRREEERKNMLKKKREEANKRLREERQKELQEWKRKQLAEQMKRRGRSGVSGNALEAMGSLIFGGEQQNRGGGEGGEGNVEVGEQGGEGNVEVGEGNVEVGEQEREQGGEGGEGNVEVGEDAGEQGGEGGEGNVEVGEQEREQGGEDTGKQEREQGGEVEVGEDTGEQVEEEKKEGEQVEEEKKEGEQVGKQVGEQVGKQVGEQGGEDTGEQVEEEKKEGEQVGEQVEEEEVEEIEIDSNSYKESELEFTYDSSPMIMKNVEEFVTRNTLVIVKINNNDLRTCQIMPMEILQKNTSDNEINPEKIDFTKNTRWVKKQELGVNLFKAPCNIINTTLKINLENWWENESNYNIKADGHVEEVYILDIASKNKINFGYFENIIVRQEEIDDAIKQSIKETDSLLNKYSKNKEKIYNNAEKAAKKAEKAAEKAAKKAANKLDTSQAKRANIEAKRKRKEADKAKENMEHDLKLYTNELLLAFCKIFSLKYILSRSKLHYYKESFYGSEYNDDYFTKRPENRPSVKWEILDNYLFQDVRFFEPNNTKLHPKWPYYPPKKWDIYKKPVLRSEFENSKLSRKEIKDKFINIVEFDDEILEKKREIEEADNKVRSEIPNPTGANKNGNEYTNFKLKLVPDGNVKKNNIEEYINSKLLLEYKHHIFPTGENYIVVEKYKGKTHYSYGVIDYRLKRNDYIFHVGEGETKTLSPVDSDIKKTFENKIFKQLRIVNQNYKKQKLLQAIKAFKKETLINIKKNFKRQEPKEYISRDSREKFINDFLKKNKKTDSVLKKRRSRLRNEIIDEFINYNTKSEKEVKEAFEKARQEILDFGEKKANKQKKSKRKKKGKKKTSGGGKNINELTIGYFRYDVKRPFQKNLTKKKIELSKIYKKTYTKYGSLFELRDIVNKIREEMIGNNSIKDYNEVNNIFRNYINSEKNNELLTSFKDKFNIIFYDKNLKDAKFVTLENQISRIEEGKILQSIKNLKLKTLTAETDSKIKKFIKNELKRLEPETRDKQKNRFEIDVKRKAKRKAEIEARKKRKDEAESRAKEKAENKREVERKRVQEQAEAEAEYESESEPELSEEGKELAKALKVSLEEVKKLEQQKLENRNKQGNETELFDTMLKSINMRQKPIKADGDCLFSSMSLFLNKKFNTKDFKPDDVRKKIVKYIANNWERYQLSISGQCGDNEWCNNIYAYIYYMGKGLIKYWDTNRIKDKVIKFYEKKGKTPDNAQKNAGGEVEKDHNGVPIIPSAKWGSLPEMQAFEKIDWGNEFNISNSSQKFKVIIFRMIDGNLTYGNVVGKTGDTSDLTQSFHNLEQPLDEKSPIQHLISNNWKFANINKPITGDPNIMFLVHHNYHFTLAHPPWELREIIHVLVPNTWNPGNLLLIKRANGEELKVKVPPGRKRGDRFSVDVEKFLQQQESTQAASKQHSEPSRASSEKKSEQVSGPSSEKKSEPSSGDASEPSSGDASEPSSGDASEQKSEQVSEPSSGDASEPSSEQKSEQVSGDASEPSSGPSSNQAIEDSKSGSGNDGAGSESGSESDSESDSESGDDPGDDDARSEGSAINNLTQEEKDRIAEKMREDQEILESIRKTPHSELSQEQRKMQEYYSRVGIHIPTRPDRGSLEERIQQLTNGSNSRRQLTTEEQLRAQHGDERVNSVEPMQRPGPAPRSTISTENFNPFGGGGKKTRKLKKKTSKKKRKRTRRTKPKKKKN